MRGPDDNFKPAAARFFRRDSRMRIHSTGWRVVAWTGRKIFGAIFHGGILFQGNLFPESFLVRLAGFVGQHPLFGAA